MQTIAVLPRILGSLLYYSPADKQIYTLFTQLPSLKDLYDWSDKEAVADIIDNIHLPELDELIYQFSVLFEGQGKMPVPPWGAVYQDKDNLLMSDSTIDYRHFLAQHQLAFNSSVNEPEDQFGLMLLALSLLIEQGKTDAVVTLLEQHLLPWGFRYLDLLVENAISDVYAAIGNVTRLFLRDLQDKYQLKPATVKLCF